MKDFTDEGVALVGQAFSLVITNREEYDTAEALGKVVNDRIKNIKAYFKPMKADAKKAHQNIVNAEKESLADYDKAKAILKQSMLTFEVEQEKLAEYEEEKLKAEFGDKAEYMSVPKMEKKGQTRDSWKHEVVDWGAFSAWCVSTGHLDYILPNDKALAIYAKTNKKSDIPGLKVFNQPIKVF